MIKITLEDSVTNIPLIGPQYAKKLEKLNIKTVENLLYHFPFRYQDFGDLKKISELMAGEPSTICATVEEIRNIYTKFGKRLTKAKVSDKSGSIIIWWFNQHYITQNIKPNQEYFFSGKLGQFSGQVSLVAPEYEKTEGKRLHTGSFVPIYPETGGISSKWLRSRIAAALKITQIDEFLPIKTLTAENLLPLEKSLNKIHLPKQNTDIKEARERLSFEELFINILKGLYKKKLWGEKCHASVITLNPTLQEKLNNLLEFTLTSDQNKVINEILKDIAKPIAMNRLLQGDVGCGKTVVAAHAILATCVAGHNCAYMAPTQILAEQHAKGLRKLLKTFKIEVSLVKGGIKNKTITNNLNNKNKSGRLFVGTHALLFKKDLPNLGLTIIDEQHRFGVKQRAKLSQSAHTLTMTATPIPRSLTLTFYGDLDISTISEMPKGRKPVTTWLVPNAKRQSAGNWLESEIKKTGEQCFWICPFIEESDYETLQTVKAAAIEFENLKRIFPKLKLGLLHGRLKADQKNKVLEHFRKREIDILVTTPVVEVGVDIPNASFIVIEGAERFGLASLHQLRGRVGRGNQKSYCLLFTSRTEFEKSSRLKALEKERNGLKLAQLDLKIRGSGEAFGTAQHGRFSLKFAELSNTKLLNRAQIQAKQALGELKKHDKLYKKVKEVEKIAIN